MLHTTLFLCGSTLLGLLTGGQEAPVSPKEEIAALMRGYAEVRAFSGAVLVARESTPLYTAAFGLANREFGVPNEVETRFSIASVTKPFTAALVVRLAEEGQLELSSTVAELLPDYRADTGGRITVHDLLTHGSGLPNYAVKEFWQGGESRLDYDAATFVARFCSGDLLFDPGTNGHYSDANYFLLAQIVERVTGSTFDQALRAELLEPIRARDSGTLNGEQIVARLATGYLRSGTDHSLPAPIAYRSVQLGAGDMYSTLGDLFRFLKALDTDGLLRAESREAIFEPYLPSGFPDHFNGYGWNIGELKLRSGRSIRVQHAPGNNAGFAAILYRLPETGHVIVLVENTGPPFLDMQIYEICEEIAHILHGELPRAPGR